MDLKTLGYDVADGVATLTLSRPAQLNAMNRAMLAEICQVLDAAERDPGARALVVTGAGKGFSAGFDLKEQMQAGLSGTADWRKALWEDFSATVKF
ncbi:MAG: enoyl-CoA hydratase/isomerase family protein [Pseudomonadota bacterium]